MALHLASAGILHLINAFNRFLFADHNTNALRAKNLEAGEGRKVCACLAADGIHLESGIVVIGHDRNLRQRLLDGGNNSLVIIAVIRLLAGQLHQCAPELILMGGTDCFELFQIVEICPDGLEAH